MMRWCENPTSDGGRRPQPSDRPCRWQELLDQVMGRVAGRFARVEPRRHARALVLGLLSDLPRKNCWTIAEHAGDASPDGIQHLLARAVWDADGVRDDVRALLVEHLGDPEAVLVVDETGDLKKGSHTVGVQRQYTGTAGKVDNAQVAVYLAYTTDAGHGVIDRELYLPQQWLADPSGAGAPASPTRSGLRPSRSWPAGCSSACWTPGCRPAG
jgi:SRSO17 transposase